MTALSIKRVRPFSTAFWLSVFTVAMPAVQIVGHPCATNFYVELAYGAIVILGFGWANHVREIAQGHFLRSKFYLNWVADLGLIALATIIVWFATIFFRPAYQCYTKRAEVTEVLQMSSITRTEITERVLKNGTLKGAGTGINIPISGRLNHAMVTSDGIMVLVSEETPALIFLVPAFESGEVKWRCEGYPLRYMPATCRSEKLLSWLEKAP